METICTSQWHFLDEETVILKDQEFSVMDTVYYR